MSVCLYCGNPLPDGSTCDEWFVGIEHCDDCRGYCRGCAVDDHRADRGDQARAEQKERL